MGRRLVKGGDLATHDADKQQPRVFTSPSVPTVLKKQKVNGSYSGAVLTEDALSFGLLPTSQPASVASLPVQSAAENPRSAVYQADASPSAVAAHNALREASQDTADVEDEDAEREDDRANDPACIVCDDGGNIMFCDGPCMRAFHCGVQLSAGSESSEPSSPDAPSSPHTELSAFHCNPLKMPCDLYVKLKNSKDILHCPNCLTGVHQCFKCKQEGVVEAHMTDASNAQFAAKLVFRCAVAECGRFYHADCVGKTEADVRHMFVCPLHVCRKCNCSQSDPKASGPLIPCRRCPKAYHERCLPHRLLELPSPKPKNWKQRIWISAADGNCEAEVERSLIYCDKHIIDRDRDTPCHERPVFHPSLVQRWHHAYADKFPEIASSKKAFRKANIEDIPLAQRRRPFAKSPAKATPNASPAAGVRAPAAVAPAATALPASREPEISVEDVPLAKRKRSSGKQLLPTSPFATAQLASPNKPAASTRLDGSAEATVPSQQLTKARDSTDGAASAVPHVSAGAPGTNRQASARLALETATADRVTATSTAPQAKVLQRSGSKLTAAGAEANQHKVSTTQDKAERQVEVLRRSDSSMRLHEQGGSSKDVPRTSKGEAASTVAGKDRSQAGLKAVKGLPALSRKLSKKGGSSGLGRLAKGSDIDAAKAHASKSASQAATPHVRRTDDSAAADTARAAVASKPAASAGQATKADSRHRPANPAPPSAASVAVSSRQNSLQHKKEPLKAAHAQPVDASAADDSLAASPPLPDSAPLPDESAWPEQPPLPQAPPPLPSDPLPGRPPLPSGDVLSINPKGQDRHQLPMSTKSSAPDARHQQGASDQTLYSDKDKNPVNGDPKPDAPSHKRKRSDEGKRKDATPPSLAAAAQAIDERVTFEVAQPITGAWQKVQDRVNKIKAMTKAQIKEEATSVVAAVLAKAKVAVTLDQVTRATRKPEPYSKPCQNTVQEDRLRVYEEAIARAKEFPDQATMFVSLAIAKDMLQKEDDFTMVLAPYMHGDRYSSYGRHFTKSAHLQITANVLCKYLYDQDTVVDFSCGANAFVPMVKLEAAHQGKVVYGRAYDIITSHQTTDFVRQSWLTVKPGDLPHGDQLVIGLNPPFGKNGTLAKAFLEQAARFDPAIIVLIVPPATFIPPGYAIDFEDKSVMSDRAFFVPGTNKESWNKVPPVLRVLVRGDRRDRFRYILHEREMHHQSMQHMGDRPHMWGGPPGPLMQHMPFQDDPRVLPPHMQPGPSIPPWQHDMLPPVFEHHPRPLPPWLEPDRGVHDDLGWAGPPRQDLHLQAPWHHGHSRQY